MSKTSSFERLLKGTRLKWLNNNQTKPAVIQINPLYRYLNKLILFKVWRKFSDLAKEHAKHSDFSLDTDQIFSSTSSFDSSDLSQRSSASGKSSTNSEY